MNRIATFAALAIATVALATGCNEQKAKGTGEAPGKKTTAVAAAPTGKPQTMCPVMAGKVDKNLYADHEGKRVYFCCAGCVDEFKKNPAKYIKKLEGAGVTLAKAPAKGEKAE